jgi:hypothetical protein
MWAHVRVFPGIIPVWKWALRGVCEPWTSGGRVLHRRELVIYYKVSWYNEVKWCNRYYVYCCMGVNLGLLVQFHASAIMFLATGINNISGMKWSDMGRLCRHEISSKSNFH